MTDDGAGGVAFGIMFGTALVVAFGVILGMKGGMKMDSGGLGVLNLVCWIKDQQDWARVIHWERDV
jgi:hypothetical protein